ncbi:aminopeptidase N-like [Chironomus tepperi]|uniref:aminopeptidase N-like n=1 Tax=Chironomus tepperi TaxID=113505 RepID=UPI00391F330A
MRLKFILLINIFIIYHVSAGPKVKLNRFNEDGFNLDDVVIPKFTPSALSFRLPNNTVPIHYDISLLTDIHLGNFDFFGTVTIDIRVLEATETITVHYRQSTIASIDLLDFNGRLIESNVNYEQIEEVEFLVIKPRATLLEFHQYKVVIRYRALLRTDDYGFYRASYLNEEGKRIWVATTQFQATDARHAFPCYDEPQIRTSFDIRIRHHQRYMAVSNMPVESITPGPINGYVVTKFQRVSSMQTYLVAFTVSDYIYDEDATVVPPQRVYAKPQSIHNNEAELALRVSPELMLTSEKHFGINYTFPKMDQIAITDFDAGAMENWGLVSYREILLLFDPLIRTTRNKEFIITIIAHEFLHQWIGNIVCPEWWTYLWINEGFATLYEHFLPHFTYPEERYDDLFLVDVMHPVLQVDANPNIRAMSHYVEDPVSIDLLFDWVAYNKAGSVLHTFMHAFGASVWQTGERNFINDRFDNFANPGHLYAAIQRSVDANPSSVSIDVASLMRTWENQAGFPVVTLSQVVGGFLVTQERFFYDRFETSTNLWSIPLNYATASVPDFSSTLAYEFWEVGRTYTFQNSSMSKMFNQGDWIILNIQQAYYYRVNYDLELWSRIINQLNLDYEVIHVRNRVQLIDDAFHLARGERVHFGIIFELMNYMWQEVDYFPWVAANRAKTSLNRWLISSSVYSQYQGFVRHNTARYFNKLGVEFRDNELHIDRYGRSLVISLACGAQLEECLRETNNELVAFLENGKRIAPEYVQLIYCNGMRTANVLHFLAMKNRLFQTYDSAERTRMIAGLGCTQNTDLLFSFLNTALLPGIELSTAEKNRILSQSASNGEHAVRVMMTFIRENFEAMSQISANTVNNALTNVAMYIGSQELFREFEDLIIDLVHSGGITIPQFGHLRELARENLNWQRDYLDHVADFFNTWEPQNSNNF